MNILRLFSSRRKRRGILLCGAYGMGNVGDEAVLHTILTCLGSAAPEEPVTVMSKNPERTWRTHGVQAIHLFHLHKFFLLARRTRLYISGGGTLLQDATSGRSLYFYLLTIWLAKALGNQVMLYGSGIGPIRRPRGRRWTAWVLKHCVDKITLRDPLSMEELETLGLAGDQALLTADPALTVMPEQPAAVDRVMVQAGLEPEGRYLGMALRPWEGFEEKAPQFAALADYAWRKYGLKTVFLPIVSDQDLGAARLTAGAVEEAPCAFLERLDGSPYQAVDLFSRMQAVVSMRLHGLIFAAAQAVPAVGVAYDPKVSAFMAYSGQDACCALEEASFPRLAQLLDRAMDRGRKPERLEALRRAEADNGRALKALLHDPSNPVEEGEKN
ncbi:MAG: polysaccharide pyruvyl transferase CsaB [Oscillospiraceae bacterium]|nr:polysaccharide pyruvyl transferase CsaB [Oscillospiraceae bacterium]